MCLRHVDHQDFQIGRLVEHLVFESRRLQPAGAGLEQFLAVAVEVHPLPPLEHIEVLEDGLVIVRPRLLGGDERPGRTGEVDADLSLSGLVDTEVAHLQPRPEMMRGVS